MSYDLLAWPVDRQMSWAEAIADIEKRATRWKIGLRHDRRIDAFERAMKARFPGIGTARSEYPMEFDVRAEYVQVSLPWSMVSELLDAIAPIAFEAGLALFDPQRELVGMPAPFGSAPLGTSGVDEHEEHAARAIRDIAGGWMSGSTAGTSFGITDARGEARFKVMSPLGFEITPDIEGDVMENPNRVPTALQTRERKMQALAALGDDLAARRHEALQLFGGWDPDTEVRAALIPMLQSDDVITVSLAASAVARQGTAGDLPAILEAVHRLSPSDGGTVEAMLMPLSAAFDLARAAAPDELDAIKGKARAWREPPVGSKARQVVSEAAFEQMLDAFAAGPEAGLPLID
jgi:hypothetical protein